jgi:hypothetical protein
VLGPLAASLSGRRRFLAASAAATTSLTTRTVAMVVSHRDVAGNVLYQVELPSEREAGRS